MQRGRRPPIRGVIRGCNPRGRGGTRITSNAPIRINFSVSSSDDESYSDDIPVIKRKTIDEKNVSIETSDENSYSDEKSDNLESRPKTKVIADLVSDYDYSDDFEAGVPVVSENQQVHRLQIENKTQYNEKESSKERTLQIEDSNLNELNRKNEYSEDSRKQSTNSDLPKNHEQSQEQVKVANQTPVSVVPKQAIESTESKSQETFLNSQENEITSLQVSKTQPSLSPSPINLLDDYDNLPLYRIVWKKSIHSKTHIQLVFNENIIFHSKLKKTKIGNCFVICTDTNIDCYSKSYQGSLKISQNSTRYTLFTPQGEQYQSHEGEVIGLSFYDPKDIKCYGVRAFRIALPKRQPYFPSTKDMNLSKIAQNNIQSDDIQIFSSKLPELFPGPVLKLQFGSVHVISSVKNFILEDGNGNVIFMIYKSSNGMCSIRIAPPITPLIAFALSIAIITSKK